MDRFSAWKEPSEIWVIMSTKVVASKADTAARVKEVLESDLPTTLNDITASGPSPVMPSASIILAHTRPGSWVVNSTMALPARAPCSVVVTSSTAGSYTSTNSRLPTLLAPLA